MMYDAHAKLIETMDDLLNRQGRGLVIRSHHFSPAHLNPGEDKYDIKSYLAHEFRMCLDDLRLGQTTDFFVMAKDYSWVAHYKLSLVGSEFQLARV